MSREDLIKVLKRSRGRLQYHTRTHYHLTDFCDVKILENELKVPAELKQLDPGGFSWLAYPYCDFNGQTIGIVKKYYKGARAGMNGFDKNHPDSMFAVKSIMVNNDTNLFSISKNKGV